MHRALVLALAGLAALAGWQAWAAADSGDMPLVRVDLGPHSVLAQVPISTDQRLRGLGGRRGLEPGRGMLFIFRFKNVSMCMRDMNFPLDFIWLDQGRVSHISAQVPPDGAGVSVRAQGEARMVLEVPGGWARAHEVRPGQSVRITPLQGKLPAYMTSLLPQDKP